MRWCVAELCKETSMRNRPMPLWFAVIALCMAVSPASATDGYFADGYGTQSKGMAGVAIAFPTDSLAVATNPASAFAVGDRFDFDADYFHPSRSSSILGNGFGPDQSFNGNSLDAFVIPEIGITHRLSEDWAVGLALFGNGGLDTAYKSNPYRRFGATGTAGVDLQQLFISPTLAYRLTSTSSIGISANIADERFKARGIGVFAGFSQDPAAVSNNGRVSSFGYGLRVGLLDQLTPWLAAGASWQSTTYAGGFNRYKGLFAGSGGFDIPSTYGVGFAVTAQPNIDIALDVRRILYSQIDAVGDNFQLLLAARPLGSNNGPGFGWQDTTSVKLGINYKIDPSWQVRAGYGYTTEPIPRSQTFLNILAPGTIQHQLTAGGSWLTARGLDVSVYGLYALPDTVKGAGSIPAGFPPAGFGGGEADIKLSEIAIGIGFGWKL